MGTFKTLDAFFRPVPKSAPGQSDSQAPDQPARRDVVDAVDADAAPAPPQPSRPHSAPAPVPVKQPASAGGSDRAPKVVAVRTSSATRAEILATMLHGRRALQGPSSSAGVIGGHAASSGQQGGTAAASRQGSTAGSALGTTTRELRLPLLRAGRQSSAELPGERPAKRPCVVAGEGPSAARTAAGAAQGSNSVPADQSGSLVALLHARSCGTVRPRRGLWLEGAPRLNQVACWDAALRHRPASVLQQDAVTQIELSSAEGPSHCRLALAQANQIVRVVPYIVLRDIAEARREASREAWEELEREDGAPGGVEDDADDEDRDGSAGPSSAAVGAAYGNRPHPLRRPRAVASGVLPWEELSSSSAARQGFRAAEAALLGPGAALGFTAVPVGGGGGSSSSSVLTIRTHQHVAALGWDPRRPGRLAMVDRSSSNVMLLDLGRGASGARPAGQGHQGPDFVRSYLTAAPASSVATFGGGSGGAAGGASGAARALTYLRYGSTVAPYTLAAAGRASGEGAVVHLWDERRGRSPVSRLTCPGGAPLVSPLEASLDGTALLGVVHPGTLVVWDVRRASSTAGGGALVSLGASAPSPSAVVAAADLLAPLAAAGCWRPVVSSLCSDPRDGGRVAILTQDGSSALWNLRANTITRAFPAPPPLSALALGATGMNPGSGPVAIQPLSTIIAAIPSAFGGGPIAPPAGAGTAVVTTGQAGLAATAVCGMVGTLQGAWDSDVCGFWHPAPVGFGGDVNVCGPGLFMANYRSGRALLSPAPAPQGGPGGISVVASSVLEQPVAAWDRPRGPAVGLEDWPVSVACIPHSGDVVTGSLGGRVSLWWKS